MESIALIPKTVLSLEASVACAIKLFMAVIDALSR
jgi:hypothetical protein